VAGVADLVSAYGEAPIGDVEPRCWRCNKLLIEYCTRPWRAKCSRCKAVNQQGDIPQKADEMLHSQTETV